MSLLETRDLSISVASDAADIELVHEISFALDAGKTLCIVGESGSGKTVTALSIIRLLEFVAPVRTSGAILMDGVDITTLSPARMRGYRGRRISMIFQEALDSLNPAQHVGRQLIEAYRPADVLPTDADGGITVASAAQLAEEKARGLLTEVGLGDTDRIMALYPHQMSGGMQQRVMIALALMSDPDLLIADEPTTALDVTTQAEILALLRRLQREHQMACVFITHDMGVAAEISDHVAVMYGGRLVETGRTGDILTAPHHPYTRALLACVPLLGVTGQRELPSIPGLVPSPAETIPGCRFAPRCPRAVDKCTKVEPPLVPGDGDKQAVACWNPFSGPVEQAARPTTANGASVADQASAEQEAGQDGAGSATDAGPLLEIEALTKVFRTKRRKGRGLGFATRHDTRAVNEVSLTVAPGEFFGLVGESGSGKTTLGRLVTALETPTSGRIKLGGHELTKDGITGDARAFRRHVQCVFQDAQASLDPRHTVARIIAEPLLELTSLRGGELDRRVATLIAEVGLHPSVADRYPAQLSGGQRQRVAIARAIGPGPRLIVADEPTSALDVSVQGQVMNLLLELRREHGIGCLFITHNLSLVLSVADRVGVMLNGDIVEIGTPETILTTSDHEYTRKLLAANPNLAAFQAQNQ
jgi:oligopeptide/dipeptide ABC transporter ATP-binding protein